MSMSCEHCLHYAFSRESPLAGKEQRSEHPKLPIVSEGIGQHLLHHDVRHHCIFVWALEQGGQVGSVHRRRTRSGPAEDDTETGNMPQSWSMRVCWRVSV